MFSEAQPFRQARLLILTAVPPAALLVRAVLQIAFGYKWGFAPMTNASLVGWTLFLWLVYLRLITVKLVTEVFRGEIRVSMRGLWRSARIPMDRIEAARAVTFDPRDWGGYGMRSNARGRAYIAHGNRAVELAMAGGSIVLLGSQREEELKQAIRQALSASHFGGSSGISK